MSGINSTYTGLHQDCLPSSEEEKEAKEALVWAWLEAVLAESCVEVIDDHDVCEHVLTLHHQVR